jgi:hypothetical protein
VLGPPKWTSPPSTSIAAGQSSTPPVVVSVSVSVSPVVEDVDVVASVSPVVASEVEASVSTPVVLAVSPVVVVVVVVVVSVVAVVLPVWLSDSPEVGAVVPGAVVPVVPGSVLALVVEEASVVAPSEVTFRVSSPHPAASARAPKSARAWFRGVIGMRSRLSRPAGR